MPCAQGVLGELHHRADGDWLCDVLCLRVWFAHASLQGGVLKPSPNGFLLVEEHISPLHEGLHEYLFGPDACSGVRGLRLQTMKSLMVGCMRGRLAKVADCDYQGPRRPLCL